ncbi:YggT family protein [Rossellomorea marisflavi]|jgi:YggT family protein|uniref:YggT family protein n=1 Tax=Rossellomorea marisflavi TaxID=189381 RepID=UPI0012F11BFA|nr:YggT family protein [Rossellomorea marisflavi]MDR4937245.1 YggT family protein [Rossellomorea marisflavi]UKS67063.1 YggT family protein [Rossellomorea marisflavi]VXB09215.1 factor involved in shape determination, distribution of nucleoids and osmotic tolerance [Bacillus sp. 349Y]
MFLLYQILSSLLNIYMWALIIYILMSWFPNARETSIGQILARICEPYLEQFRKFIPPLGMIDISPIVAFIVLRLADKGLSQLFLWIL